MKWGEKRGVPAFPFPVCYPWLRCCNGCSWRTTLTNDTSSYSTASLALRQQRFAELGPSVSAVALAFLKDLPPKVTSLICAVVMIHIPKA